MQLYLGAVDPDDTAARREIMVQPLSVIPLDGISVSSPAS